MICDCKWYKLEAIIKLFDEMIKRDKRAIAMVHE